MVTMRIEAVAPVLRIYYRRLSPLAISRIPSSRIIRSCLSCKLLLPSPTIYVRFRRVLEFDAD